MTSLSFVDVAENKRITKESHVNHIRNTYISISCFLFFTNKILIIIKETPPYQNSGTLPWMYPTTTFIKVSKSFCRA
jgi:hypothetical protein